MDGNEVAGGFLGQLETLLLERRRRTLSKIIFFDVWPSGTAGPASPT